VGGSRQSPNHLVQCDAGPGSRGGDRFDAARHHLEAFAATEFDLPMDPDWLTGMAMYAEAAIACRDPQYAEPLFDRLAPWAGQLV
jgi:hypothetical protein